MRSRGGPRGPKLSQPGSRPRAMRAGRMPRAWAMLMPARRPALRAGREAATTRAAEPLPSQTATISPASSGSARSRAARGNKGTYRQAIRVMGGQDSSQTSQARRHEDAKTRRDHEGGLGRRSRLRSPTTATVASPGRSKNQFLSRPVDPTTRRASGTPAPPWRCSFPRHAGRATPKPCHAERAERVEASPPGWEGSAVDRVPLG